jgi:hypothetical protein
MYNLHYHIYRLPQPVIHQQGWYSFCLINTPDKSSLLLLDPTSAEMPDGLNEGVVFSVQEDQLPQQVKDSLKKFPLFYQNGHGPFPLGTLQKGDVSCLFEKIASQINTTYIYKDYLLANLALQLIHFGIKHFAAVSAV